MKDSHVRYLRSVYWRIKGIQELPYYDEEAKDDEIAMATYPRDLYAILSLASYNSGEIFDFSRLARVLPSYNKRI